MSQRSTSARFGVLACACWLGLVACKGELATSGGISASSGSPDSGLSRPTDASLLPGAGKGGGGGGSKAGSGGTAGQRSPSDASVNGTPDARVMDAMVADTGTRPPDATVTDAGPMPGPDAAVPSDAQVSQGDPVILAVGYLGLRVMSKDLGRTWEHKTSFPDPGGDLDNPLLLRAAAYGNGLFVAAGHRIFTSPDAINWTERDNPQDQWFGGVQWGNNRFVAAGGYGESWWSSDGITWHAGGKRTGNNSHARAVAFGNGEFRASTDDGNWWTSTNGESWTQISSGHNSRIAFCRGDFHDRDDCGAAFGHNVYIKGGEWDQDVISYSDDGDNWHNVSVDYVGSLTGIAFGFD